MVVKKGMLQVEGMRHPLLLQGALAPLPQPPSAASEDVGTSYLDSYAPGAHVPRESPSYQPPHPEAHQVHITRDLHQPFAQCAVFQIKVCFDLKAECLASGEVCFEPHVIRMQARKAPPQSVDFRVPPGVSVVTLTGPNTGGKTASLKALGLTAAMARAGLFLPLKPSEGEQPCQKSQPGQIVSHTPCMLEAGHYCCLPHAQSKPK